MKPTREAILRTIEMATRNKPGSLTEDYRLGGNVYALVDYLKRSFEIRLGIKEVANKKIRQIIDIVLTRC